MEKIVGDIKSEETVGKFSYELQQKDEEVNPIDLQRSIHDGNKSEDSYENQVRLAVSRGLKDFQGNFFVVVLFRKERLLAKVIRQQFFPRKSCPTPQYDQVVYKYDHIAEDLSFLWVIPDKATCHTLPKNKWLIPLEQQQFVQYVDDFLSGKLDKMSDALNRQEKIA